VAGHEEADHQPRAGFGVDEAGLVSEREEPLCGNVRELQRETEQQLLVALPEAGVSVGFADAGLDGRLFVLGERELCLFIQTASERGVAKRARFWLYKFRSTAHCLFIMSCPRPPELGTIKRACSTES